MWVDIAWAFGEADHGLRPGDVDAARIFAVLPLILIGLLWLTRIAAETASTLESCIAASSGTRACAAGMVCLKRTRRPVWAFVLLPLLPLAPFLGGSAPESGASQSILFPLMQVALSIGPGMFMRFRYAAAADRGAAIAGEQAAPESLVAAQILAALAMALGPAGLLLSH